jgi:hypothetical protein
MSFLGRHATPTETVMLTDTVSWRSNGSALTSVQVVNVDHQDATPAVR